MNAGLYRLIQAGFLFYPLFRKKNKKNCGFVQHTGKSDCLCNCKYPKLSSFWIAVFNSCFTNVLNSWFCIRLTNCLAEKESRFPGLFFYSQRNIVPLTSLRAPTQRISYLYSYIRFIIGEDPMVYPFFYTQVSISLSVKW